MSKNHFIMFTICFAVQLGFAQTFTEELKVPFERVPDSKLAFADIDNDGDQDILITGCDIDTTGPFLYFNNGFGVFTTEANSNIICAFATALAFADVDGDKDEDLVFTGFTGNSGQVTILYKNGGQGNFSAVNGSFDEEVESASIVFADIDNDGDQDVFISGQNSGDFNLGISNLYINDGDGNFEENGNNSFPNIVRSSADFADVDGDGDLDLLLAGKCGSVWYQTPCRFSKLYINDGLGNFTVDSDTMFEAGENGTITFSDIDNDGDQDVLITGLNSSLEVMTNLYRNNGKGEFEMIQNANLVEVQSSSVAFSDIDGDGDEDLLITGRRNSYSMSTAIPISIIYINDGSGNFTASAEIDIENVYKSSVAFADIDNDGDEDLLITGRDSSNDKITKLYRNNTIVSSTKSLNQEINFEFSLFPNPTNASKINISYESTDSEIVSLNIYDIEGKLKNNYQDHMGLGLQTYSIDISSLNKGTYILQIDDGTRKGYQKFIVY